jgi:glycerol-3-phosphate O-acyltransferase
VVLGAPGTRSRPSRARRATSCAIRFVRVQGVKALSLAQRQVFGARYKVPRLLAEQILGDTGFQDRIAAAGATLGLTREESRLRGERALHELATSHNLFSMEIFRRIARWLYSLAFDPAIDVGRQLESCAARRRAPLVFIPSHNQLVTTWRSTRCSSRPASRRRTPRPGSTCRSSR